MKHLPVYLALAIILSPLSALAFSNDLFYGVRKNPEVQELQEFLTDQGLYSGPITGNFFSLTLKAVKSFQTANSIKSTGYFGPLTRAKANDLLAEQGVGQTLTDESGVSTTPTIIPPNNDVVSELKKQNDLLTHQNQVLGQIQQNTIPLPHIMPSPTPEPVKELTLYADPVAGLDTKSVNIHARYTEDGNPILTSVTFITPRGEQTFDVRASTPECPSDSRYLIQRKEVLVGGNCSKDGVVKYFYDFAENETSVIVTASSNGLSKSITISKN